MPTVNAKKDCSQINWEETDTTWIKDNWSWVFPQVCALIGRLPLVKFNGLVNPTTTAQRIRELGEHHWPNGAPVRGFARLWRMLQTTPRGNILGGTQNGAASRYNSGVPLILSCWREHRGVLYSSWDWTDSSIVAFVDKDVLGLVRDLGSIDLSDDVLDLRESARVVKTGVKSGSLRNLTSVIPFGGLGSEAFQNLSRLTKYCVTQTWIYHPSVRHPYQICGVDLDNHPPPLVTDEVLISHSDTTQPDNPFDL